MRARPIFWGLAQALAAVVICGLGVAAVTRLQRWESSSDGFLDKVALVLVLVASALVGGTVILGRPAYLALQQRAVDAFRLLLYTVLWVGVLLVLIVFFDVHAIV